MAFYGAIEQVLTGWIFDLLPAGEEDFEQAKRSWSRRSAAGLRGRPATAWRPAL